MSLNSSRYQAGSLERISTKEGPVWFVRFRATEGGKKRPRFRLGLVRDLPTKKQAKQAADDLRRQFNAGTLVAPSPRLFREVIAKYKREEMPSRYGTAKGYRNWLKNHIEPEWGNVPLAEIKADAVRKWLQSKPVSTKTRGHIRDMMRTLFRFAMLWEWIPAAVNPMALFQIKGASKRTKKLVQLTPQQYLQILKHPRLNVEPYNTMIRLAAYLGLSCSELFALQWGDIDWINGKLIVMRSIVDGHVDAVKTEQRSKPIPLHPEVLRLLREHRSRSIFRGEDDWIFASPHTGGEMPYHAQHIQTDRIAKAVASIGLPPGVGWHAFRHAYRGWLDAMGASAGVQKDLMRHADISTTMNIYGGSYVEGLRDANDKVISMLKEAESRFGPVVAQEVSIC